MKKVFMLLSFIALSCSSDDTSVEVVNQPINEPEVPTPTFTINAVVGSSSVNVDEAFTVTITSEENMAGILFSYDNFMTEFGQYTNYGTSKELNFTLDEIGVTTIYFKAMNENNVYSQVKSVDILVNRGNAVKITGFQVISFNGIDTTWDPEYPSTNPDHLADVFFGFHKTTIGNPFYGTYSYHYWYQSVVKQNQGDLTWDLTNENLYIKPEKTIRMGLADSDGDIGQDLMMGPPDYRDFNLSAYTTTMPNTVTLTYPEINLQFVVSIEWPN